MSGGLPQLTEPSPLRLDLLKTRLPDESAATRPVAQLLDEAIDGLRDAHGQGDGYVLRLLPAHGATFDDPNLNIKYVLLLYIIIGGNNYCFYINWIYRSLAAKLNYFNNSAKSGRGTEQRRETSPIGVAKGSAPPFHYPPCT